jgi:uncharacterized membrane protein YjjP (DUF1212 family)
MAMQRIETEMLACAGGLLLEYNESTRTIQRTLEATAKALSDERFDLTVLYGGVVVSLGDDGPELKPVRELRYNAALQARVHSILRSVRDKELDASAASAELARAEANAPAHNRWLTAVLLGVAASGLAVLLGADSGAVMAAGVATSLGLLARQELGRRHTIMLALPFTAALIGAALGGIAIRFGWTQTPGLVLIVPSLMIIPGPHLINGLLDLIDNFLPMSLARLGLATGILIASALGIILGIELTLSGPPVVGQSFETNHLNLISDMLLAAVVTCGFAIYYNASWVHIGMAVLGGMAGHGLRFLALNAGCRLEVATFLGGLAVGIVSALIVRCYKVPFAVIAFAGAVTMMPGLQMYRALGGFLLMAHQTVDTERTAVAVMLANASQASLVIGALALGLIVAARIMLALSGEQDVQSASQ